MLETGSSEDAIRSSNPDSVEGIVLRLAAFGIQVSEPQQAAFSGLSFDQALRLVEVGELFQIRDCLHDLRVNTENVDEHLANVASNTSNLNTMTQHLGAVVSELESKSAQPEQGSL
ncbi:hypothetical protein F1721_06965 [Saccharopolyspora hirsuta]|uniref:Uncharacterized protein n=1 Tax=Saccharopolyspora hirsuta TaxID=1837 RepID=A0A5M7C294_SACHI|nr:hypothetical protein [Saccharopolyspora hirsuta]KAA5836072.1 hypothetical protein F1721_06965 [Saccharopolyspora hirsuta]